ncbi:MAG: Smr/MutS family protein [Gemmatimonadaceae bacterium]
MKLSPRRPYLEAVRQALDEARFGRERTLNLRASLPTVAEARARTEAWLRERQVARAGEVLIITGRGNRSVDGISAVRVAVLRLLASLRRRGVVAAAREHTPGSFVVELAPVRALRSAPRRKREREPAPVTDPSSLQGLAPDTRALLRRLAELSLAELGVRDARGFVEQEMLAQFALIAAGVPEGGGREQRLARALRTAIAEYEDG